MEAEVEAEVEAPWVPAEVLWVPAEVLFEVPYKQYLESVLQAHKVLRFLLLGLTNPAHPGGRQTRQAHPGGG